MRLPECSSFQSDLRPCPAVCRLIPDTIFSKTAISSGLKIPESADTYLSLNSAKSRVESPPYEANCRHGPECGQVW